MSFLHLCRRRVSLAVQEQSKLLFSIRKNNHSQWNSMKSKVTFRTTNGKCSAKCHRPKRSRKGQEIRQLRLLIMCNKDIEAEWSRLQEVLVLALHSRRNWVMLLRVAPDLILGMKHLLQSLSIRTKRNRQTRLPMRISNSNSYRTFQRRTLEHVPIPLVLLTETSYNIFKTNKEQWWVE